jgi:hypothetical protein
VLTLLKKPKKEKIPYAKVKDLTWLKVTDLPEEVKYGIFALKLLSFLI